MNTRWDSYLSDGGLSIDNNAAERAVKPFAIGRIFLKALDNLSHSMPHFRRQ